MSIPKIVFVGGFLGAGKTTLILKAARSLEERGQRVALIMNDQDSELADTHYARAERFATREVAGGCFCCLFSDLLERAKELRGYNPSVIFAEPVGSCIDLSATILQPFQAFHSDLFETAPLTVLLDPQLTYEVLSGEAAPEISYLFQQQIREADILCLTKTDLYPELPQLPFPVDFQISSRSGMGVDAWMEEVLSGRRVAGARLLDVDYHEYAAAEAALGWLNVHVGVRLESAASPAEFTGSLLDKLNDALSAGGIQIVHLKLFDQTYAGYVMVSIRANGAEPDPQGDLVADSTTDHQLALNLRALGDGAPMRAIVERVLSEIAGSVEITHFRAFQPLPPKPEHRFAKAVGMR
jgi:Ni2+-binding GTPase involved in maturation of urease and hydrogenase